MKSLSVHLPISFRSVKSHSRWRLALSYGVSTILWANLSFAQTKTIANEESEPLGEEAIEALAEADAADAAEEDKNYLDYNEASTRTRKDARTMTLSIPAPRGQIVDRFGYPYAQSKVIWYPAIQMDQFEDESDEFIISWCHEKIQLANERFGCDIQVSDKKLIEHYRHRRWIPMPFKYTVSTANKDRYLKSKEPIEGIILHPIYQRTYPEKSSAAHIIGYVGSKSSNLERGPINYGDPLFWELEGRGGLEKHFDSVLKGTDGQRRLQYDSYGREVRREDFAPKPGGTVVTTIDMEWQKRAERVLRQHSNRGAFVVIDIETGEILVMASRPSYDLNLWVPYMKTETFKELQENKGKPFYARAFSGQYPPASAFKVVTGIAALETKAIYKKTSLECPAYIKLGNHKFWDWSKKTKGYLSITTATALSNNPFFIQAALKAEKKQEGRFMTVASHFGYGKRPALPLDAAEAGNLLSNEYTLKKYERTIKQGDIANAAIGQGAILASPLQVAQSMAAIGNDGVLPKIHLIKQIQNNKGVITMASRPQPTVQPAISKEAIKAVKEGMYKVVNASFGTGKRGAISYSLLCGKTGTAQWGPGHLNQNLAWFAGFFPYKNPKYAFAVLYEGAPGEKVSGGKKAAPMVPAFFNPLKGQAFSRHRQSNRATVDESNAENLVSPLGDPFRGPTKAVVIEAAPEEIEPAENGSEAGAGEEAIPEVAENKPPRALVVEEFVEEEEILEENGLGIEESISGVPQVPGVPSIPEISSPSGSELPATPPPLPQTNPDNVTPGVEPLSPSASELPTSAPGVPPLRELPASLQQLSDPDLPPAADNSIKLPVPEGVPAIPKALIVEEEDE